MKLESQNCLFKLFAAFLLLLQEVQSVQILCEFRLNSQECKVEKLKVFENDTEVTSISGFHSFRKTNKDVKEIWIAREVETEIAPTNFCKYFENMERIDIYGANIKRVTRNVFKNCVKARKVCILFTAVSTFDEDVFEDLTQMKELFLYENKLVMLPPMLLAKNLALTTFSARTNQLKIIDIEFPPSVNSIDFTSNLCINKKAPEDYSLGLLKKEVAEKCANPMKKTLADQNGKITQLEANLTKQENEIIYLTMEMVKVKIDASANISQLMQENIRLKDEADIRDLELETMRMNSTEKEAKLLDQNKAMALNVTTCQQENGRKAKLLQKVEDTNKSLRSKSENFQADNESVIRNLTACKQTASVNQVKTELLLAENFNLNGSLEECWQNVSSNDDANEDLRYKITQLEAHLYQSRENCTAMEKNLKEATKKTAEHLTSNGNCRNEIHAKYFLLLALTFVGALVVIVLYMRRQASRNLIRNMINHEVTMKGLMNE